MQEDPKRRNLKLSMTPLIDMVFLLLVFFMLTTSFIKKEGLAFSQSTSKDQTSQSSNADKFILISLEEKGTLLVNKTRSHINNFIKIIKPLLTHDGTQRIFIQILGSPKVQDLVTVVDMLNIAGVTNITFIDSSRGQNYLLGGT